MGYDRLFLDDNIIMKKTLFTLLALGIAMGATAETKYYTSQELSDNVSVSPKGLYAVTTATDESYSYIWDAANPEVFTQVEAPNKNKIELYGISDNGVAVGAYYAGNNLFIPCFVKDGKIEDLPMPLNVMYENFAKCITGDGKTIGGYVAYNDPESEVGMRYRPIFWRENEQGEYEYEFNPDMEIPAHQGFIVNCMNPEGTILGGRLYCAAGSEIPALYKDGKLEYWYELKTIVEPFYYKDKLLGYYENYYIDGMKDGCKGDFVIGEFAGADAWGNFYGRRTNVDYASEDGEDYQLSNYAFIYNVNTGKSLDYPAAGGITAFSTGIGKNREYVFCNGDRVLMSEGDEDLVKSVTGTFNFTSASTMTAVLSVSYDGQVIAGTRQELHPGTGEQMYFPFVVVLDNPLCEAPDLSAVDVVTGQDGSTIVLSAGRIDIIGGEGMVFDLGGSLVGSGSTVNVPAGIYVVKTGDVSRKVMVK